MDNDNQKDSGHVVDISASLAERILDRRIEEITREANRELFPNGEEVEMVSHQPRASDYTFMVHPYIAANVERISKALSDCLETLKKDTGHVSRLVAYLAEAANTPGQREDTRFVWNACVYDLITELEYAVLELRHLKYCYE